MAHRDWVRAQKRPAMFSLPGFLVASLVLHALLLSVWNAPDPLTGPVKPGDRVLVVELGKITVSHTARPTDRQPAVASHQTLLSVPTAGTGSASADTINHVLGEIRTSLSRYLVYPPLARARGWQGTVMLGFDVVPDGRLEKIHVARSSGHAVLDRAAMEALTRVARLEPNAHKDISLPLAMRLPVIYRLTER